MEAGGRLSGARRVAPDCLRRGSGVGPRWGNEGELFFRSRDRYDIMRVEYEAESTFDPLDPEILFPHSNYTFSAPPTEGRPWDVAPDGRFLMIKMGDAGPGNRRIVVVQNWVDGILNRLVPLN